MSAPVLEILTEEISMELFLRELLPKILPAGYKLDENCFIRPHEGKSHLLKSLTKKMKAYPRYPYPVKVLIVQDQDSNDCVELKKKLLDYCSLSPEIPSLVRIACKELENWYLGDLSAIEQVYPDSKATKFLEKAKFRNPDKLTGSQELKALSSTFTKMQAAREIPQKMDIKSNKSPSFNQFVTGIQKLLNPREVNP